MGDLWLQVSTASDRDRALLDADYAPKMLREDIAGDETTLLTHPDDARLHRDLALCYLEDGRTDEAVAEFERSLALEPNAVDQHYELGVILLKANKFDAAAKHFRRAVELKPDDAEKLQRPWRHRICSQSHDEAIRCSSSRCALATTRSRITTWGEPSPARVVSTRRWRRPRPRSR